MYERYLKGRDGLILTTSDAKGTELQNAAEERVEPVPGNTLTSSYSKFKYLLMYI